MTRFADTSVTPSTTESQREIWTACQLGPDASLAYSESVTLVLQGMLDVPAIKKALNQLVQRHESLRIRFSEDGHSFQVTDAGVLEIPLHKDVSDHLSQAKLRAVNTPYDLSSGLLFRPEIIVGNDKSYVIISAHHIVCDGWSMAILMRDLGALYTANLTTKDTPATLPPAPSFTDFATHELEYQNGSSSKEDLDYWQSVFASGVPIMDLPADRNRPKMRTFTSARIDRIMPADLIKSIKKIASKERSSFFMALFGAYQILLWKIAGTESGVVTAVPAAAQTTSGLFDLVGHCINTLPVRGEPQASQSFIDCLRSTRQRVLDAFEHQRSTFGRILQVVNVERDPSRLPLSPIIFNVDKKFESSDLGFQGLNATYESNPRIFEAFEIFINIAESNGVCTIECQYNADLYSPEWIQSHLASYEALIQSIVENPTAKLSKLNWTPIEQLEQLYFSWNRRGEYPKAQTMLELIDDHATARPEAVAVTSGSVAITYRELAEESNRWARFLSDKGISPGSFVGVTLERSASMLPLLLGIMKAGACYVPLDPTYPKDRLQYMIKQSGCTIVLADPAVLEAVPNLENLETISTQQPMQSQCSAAAVDYARYVTGSTLAYVIFTSGSTGQPKGVLVPHVGVVNLLSNIAREPGFSASDRLLAVTTLSFDVSVAELYLPLTVGGQLIVANSDEVKDGRLLAELIAKHDITFMPATPATWRMLLDVEWKGAPLKAISTGEALPADLANELVTYVASLWNYYGPTEVTVWATGEEVHRNQPITIGSAIPGITVYIVDRFGMPVPRHFPGELYLGGIGVTKGYVGRPDLTAERFIKLPGVPELSDVYKTGDLVRLQTDGRLDYIGRNDNQVKVRGFRIELGDIEAAVASTPGMSQALVMVREDRPDDKRIVAYGQSDTATEQAVIAWCSSHLPSYMVPQHCVILQQMPLLPNGKINRKALPSPTVDLGAISASDELQNDTERRLAAIWGPLLGVETVPATRSFYNLGGHSILATRMLALAQKEFGATISLRTFLENNSIRELSKSLVGPNYQALETIPEATNGSRARLSIIQERVYYLDMLSPQEIVNLLPDGRTIRGPFDAKLFADVIRTIVDRHPLLRSTVENDLSGPMMKIRESVDFDLNPIDLTHLTSEQQQIYLAETGGDMASRPLDVHAENLFRFRLFRLAPDVHVFATVFHHLIWDGWCFDIFWDEIHTLYLGRARGEQVALTQPGCRYLDFAVWHRQKSASAEFRAQLPFWTKYLGGMQCLELPTDWPRPARKGSHGNRQQFYWDKRQTNLLEKLAREEKTTPFSVMLAMFKYILAIYSGQRDIVVGTPVQGRGHPDFANVIGYFVNTLVLRTKFSQRDTFRDMLKAVKSSSEDALRHQDVAFEDIAQALDIRPDASRTTIYSVMFAFQDTSNRATNWQPLQMEQINLPQNAVGTDIVFWVRKHGAGLTGGFDYRTDLFSDARMAAMIGHVSTLLETLCEQPDRQMFIDPILPPPASLAASSPGSREATTDILQFMRASALKFENQPYIIHDEASCTGAEFLSFLDEALSQLSQESPIIAAPAADQSRGDVATFARALCFTIASLARGSSGKIRAASFALSADLDISRLHTLIAALPSFSYAQVDSSITSADSLRWVIVALSSGRPLIVRDTDRRRQFRISRSEKTLNESAIFLTSYELANMLALGLDLPTAKALVIAGPLVSRDIVLRVAQSAPQTTFVFGAPTAGMWAVLGKLREPSQGDQPIDWRSLGGHVAILAPGLGSKSADSSNKASIASHYMSGEIAVELGQARLEVSDATLAGTGYGGIFGQHGLEVFGHCANLGTAIPANSFYKVRREEQERALLHCAGVVNATIMCPTSDSSSAPSLRAQIVVASQSSGDEIATLRAILKRQIPPYLMCGEINFIDALPLDKSGDLNLDHKFLHQPILDHTTDEALQTDAEIDMAEIWRRVLAIRRVTRHDNFFDLGGHSLLPLLIINEIEQRTGIRMEIGGFLAQDLKSLAAQSGLGSSTRICEVGE